MPFLAFLILLNEKSESGSTDNRKGLIPEEVSRFSITFSKFFIVSFPFFVLYPWFVNCMKRTFSLCFLKSEFKFEFELDFKFTDLLICLFRLIKRILPFRKINENKGNEKDGDQDPPILKAKRADEIAHQLIAAEKAERVGEDQGRHDDQDHHRGDLQSAPDHRVQSA